MNKQEAAIFYAQRNIPVFTLYGIADGRCECSKGAACEHAGKHPRTAHGMKDASTDIETVKNWWSRWENANIALLTGAQSGFIVVDVDKRNGGMESLEKLKNLNGGDFKTFVVRSGGGGLHYYFKHPGGGVFIKSKPLDGFKGVDIRGDNGSIIAAGSTHASGGVYEIAAGKFEDIASLPSCLLELLSKPHKESNNASAGESIPEGERNHRLTQIAGSLRRASLSEDAIKAALHIENKQKCQPPLSEMEVEDIAKSISRYPAKNDATTIEGNNGGIIFNPKPITTVIQELQAGEGLATSWIWTGFIPAGGVTVMAGQPKKGKSTLAGHLAVAVSTGAPFLGYATKPVNVLWLGLEERIQDVARRFYNLGAGNTIYYQPAPFKATAANLKALGNFAAAHNVKLVVVDTMLHMFDVVSENDAVDMTNALKPVVDFSREKGISFLLLHHVRKLSAEARKASIEADNLRGSSAIHALADVTVTLFHRDSEKKNMRELYMTTRYEETPCKLTVELTADGFVASIADENKQDEKVLQVQCVLSVEWQTVKAIAEKVNLAESTVLRICRQLVSQGTAEGKGSGKKGDPFMFRLCGQEGNGLEKIMPPNPAYIGGIKKNDTSDPVIAMVKEVFPDAKIITHTGAAKDYDRHI